MLIFAAVGAALFSIERSDFSTRVDQPLAQPVPFSHQHHVGSLGIDCRYCHTSVETSAFAGVPPTETCMSCHSQIWQQAPILQPVRDSWSTGRPLRWTRVHDLPDYVFFDHSIHVQKGVGCELCHGRVESMPITWKTQPLYMSWCLDCHRHPGKYLRPREQAFTAGYNASSNQAAFGRILAARYNINTNGLTDCYSCHR